jgi:hypothetical protein
MTFFVWRSSTFRKSNRYSKTSGQHLCHECCTLRWQQSCYEVCHPPCNIQQRGGPVTTVLFQWMLCTSSWTTEQNWRFQHNPGQPEMHSLSLCERCMVLHSEHWPRQQLGRVALQPLYTILWCVQGLLVIGCEVIKVKSPLWFGEEVSAVATKVLQSRPLFAWCIEWFTILNVQFWDLQYIYFPKLQRLWVCQAQFWIQSIKNQKLTKFPPFV